jgi:predicted RNA-binding protein with PIN domain
VSATSADPPDDGSFAELFAEYEHEVPTPRRAQRSKAAPGTTDDDVEHLVRREGTVVVVDGYNVAMRGWPAGPIEVRRSALVRFVSELAQRWMLTMVIVVFDGDDTPLGHAPTDRTARNVRVEFSASHEEADDVIARTVRVSASGRRYAVVTDDRDLAARCLRAGASVLSSAGFLGLAAGS